MIEQDNNKMASERNNLQAPPTPPMVAGRRGSRAWLASALLVATAVGVAAGFYGREAIHELFGGHQEQASTAAAPKQLWTCGMHPQVIQDKPGNCPICGMALEPMKMDNAAARGEQKGERKVAYWWDPMMSPPYISGQPGKSPMGMDLVPVYEDDVAGGAAITIDPAVVQNMGVRIAKVEEGAVLRSIRAVGYLQQSQPRVHDVNLRVSGWVEKLFADTEGMLVKEGEPLFELYSPEIQVGVDELLIAMRSAKAMPADADETSRRTADVLVEVARRKLEQWGLRPTQIEELAKLDKAPRTVTFLSPVTAEVTEKMVVQGAMVKMGERAMRLVDRSTLWLDAQVYAQDFPFVSLGQQMSATVEGMPGREFEGEVLHIHPEVDPVTRTMTVRLSLPNPELLLRPGMFATARMNATLAEGALLIPREAVLDTGTRQVVFISMGDGHFEPRKVQVGNSSEDGAVQVLSGLKAGDTVVTSGQFLMDSESRMREAIQKHLSGTLLSKAAPSERQPAESSKAPLVEKVAGSAEWNRGVDATMSAYLKISEQLGAVQVSDRPVETDDLRKAVEELERNAQSDGQRKLAGDVSHGVQMIDGKTLAQQREGFTHLSDAAIALADASPPSKAVAGKLYVLYCSMAPGHWLQNSEESANPYYATDMKQCAVVKRTIEAAR